MSLSTVGHEPAQAVGLFDVQAIVKLVEAIAHLALALVHALSDDNSHLVCAGMYLVLCASKVGAIVLARR